MFSLPRAPKPSQNIGIYDVFATTKNASVAKTPLFATLWLVFTVFCENTCTKHRKYQRIQRLHFPWQQATKSKNTDIYSVSAQRFFQKKVLFGQFLASEASQNKAPSPLVTSHFLTSLYSAFISGGQQSQLKFVELFPRGDHGCYTAIATGKHNPKCHQLREQK